MKTILSNQHSNFIKTISSEMPSRINVDVPEVPKFFRQYEYPVSSWPVIIDEDTVDRLSELSTKLPELIHQIPTLYFSNDIKKIADFYFEGDEMITQFALMCHNKQIDIGSRLDLTFTKEGFKVLEVNMGSSIGGWQIQSFESIIRDMHPELSNVETNHTFKSKNTQSIYIKFLVDKTLQFVSSVDQEVNIFFSLNDSLGDKLKKDSVIFFNELLQVELQKRGLKGSALSGNVSSLKLVNGKLLLQNTEIHCVLALSLDSFTQIPPDIFRAFITDKVYFPDHLGVSILGDKRNLALLRILAEENKFSDEDNILILKSIPWTALIETGNLIFKGQDYEFFELLRKKKDQFVIKAANGFQGKDVFVGKFSTIEEWENTIKMALTHKDKFIIQEFSDSIDFLAPNITNEWVPHKLIWGSFGFGTNYGGVWVRMSALQTDVGIINSATGAVEAIVYETV